MKLSLNELGNQESRYMSGKLAGVEPRLLRVAPDLFIRSQLEGYDPRPNPMLDVILPLLSRALASREDLVITPFPHELDPAILIADPLRDRGYHLMLLDTLRELSGKGLISSVSYNTSFYKY